MAETRRQWTDEQRRAIVRDHVEGMTRADVLRKYQLSPSVFDRMRDAWETKVKKEIKAEKKNPQAPPTAAPASSSTAVVVVGGRGNRLPQEIQAQIIERINAGEKGPAIAEALGVHVSSVYYYAKKLREGDVTATNADALMPTITGPMVKFAIRTEENMIQNAAAQKRRFTWGEKQALLLVAMVTGEASD